MSEHTPTTEQVRLKFAYEPRPANGTSPTLMADFDRWLDQERAAARREGQVEAWEEAVASAYLHETEHFTSIKHAPNPYLEGRHVDQ